MRRFHRGYFILAIALLLVEIILAAFIEDAFMRPYVGDFLVVILIYCFIRNFVAISVSKLALWVLLFAYAIEALQYFKFLKIIGLQKNKLASIVVGNSLAFSDLVAYTAGIIVVLLVERTRAQLIHSDGNIISQSLQKISILSNKKFN